MGATKKAERGEVSSAMMMVIFLGLAAGVAAIVAVVLVATDKAEESERTDWVMQMDTHKVFK